MKKTTWSGILLSVGIAAALVSCGRKASETAANPTPEPTAAPTVTAPPVTPQAAALTTDPVVVSQRNAERRRHRREAPAGSAEEAPPVSRESAAREHEAAAGSILRVAFQQTISSATAKPGDAIRGELLDDLIADDGVVVAPSGSRVVGRVEQATASGSLGGQAELVFRLTELTPTGGRPVPVSTSAYEHRGETHTKHDAEYIAGGAAVGALLGQLIGRDSRSTAIGAAAGAAAGTGAAAATGKLDIVIQAGRTVAFTLEQPLRLRAAS